MIFDRHQKSIIWEKWRDPFLGYDDNEIDIDNIDQINTQYDDEETGDQLFKKTGPPIRVMATPMGLIPYNEYTASSKIFNFWIGHTNFTISKKIADIIETTDGIETLDIFTRYRFRIGVGKAFEDGEIMRFIEERIIKNE